MSDVNDTYRTGGSAGAPREPGQENEGKLDTAKEEAAHVKDTAAEQAKDLLSTTKEEASSVVGEAKTQAKDLFAQTRQELTDQAQTQQQRLAGGLRSVGDELDTMARTSEGTGVASDLVGQVSQRLTGVASWLEARDPGAVVTEVKRYARRKPGAFILGALVAGVVVGRLTRALAAGASADRSGQRSEGSTTGESHRPLAQPATTAGGTEGVVGADSPIFDRSSGLSEGSHGERRDTF